MIQYERLLAFMAAEKETVFNFFAVFSRFEYALKLAGFIPKGDQQKAEANWTLFASDLRGHFDGQRTQALREAVDFIMEHPPLKEVVDGNSTRFVECRISGATDLPTLVVYIRRMRNNLFHGGKYPRSPAADPERNTRLLRHGLTVLEECLVLCEEHVPAVHIYFYTGALPVEERGDEDR